jgi:hypothetical protein
MSRDVFLRTALDVVFMDGLQDTEPTGSREVLW